MLPHPARRSVRGSTRRLAALACLSITIFSASCDKVPLLAPTGSVITLFATASTVPSNGSMEIVATIIEQGSTAAAATGGTTGTPATTTAPTSSSSPGAGTPVHNGTVVSFTTTIGHVDPREARTDNGQVRVRFFADGQSGTATITAYSGGASGTLKDLKVGTAAAERLTLVATPQTLPASGGTTELQARVEDASGNPLPGVTVAFSSDVGTLSASNVPADSNGIATTRLTTSQKATVTAKAAAQTTTLTVALSDRTGITITPPGTSPTENQPTSIQVAVSATANVQDVIVNFGDGSSPISLGRLAGTTSVSHTYRSDGTYLITATAVAADGARESVSTSITVLPQRPLAVSITASPACAVKGVTRVTFTAQTSGGTPTGYSWDFGNGDTAFSTGPTTQYTYPATTTSGQLPVTVRVTALDADTGVGQTTITVAAPGGCTTTIR